jgi:hypothetical protein
MARWFYDIKLTDYEERWDELEQSDNPFAVAVMAHLMTRTTRGDPEDRRKWKTASIIVSAT